jgi:hypothetical protein
MKIYKISNWFEENGLIDRNKSYKIDYVESPSFRQEEMILYRGMDINLDKYSENITLLPSKSEQQSIWFSRNKQDAIGRGDYILTYPLSIKRHFEIVHYDDGRTVERVPEHIEELTNPIEDCQYFAGMELPEGWYWSYKVQKYIVCKIPLSVNKSMFEKDVEEYD